MIYDFIIIGAGVSGLVSGCYLSKSGYKCLIVERTNKVGGYCSSFSKEGFYFDSAAHSLGNCKKGPISLVLKELKLKNKLKLIQSQITDKIFFGDESFIFPRSLKSIEENLGKKFPSERINLKTFFTILRNESINQLYLRCKGKTFFDLLNENFNNKKLKEVLEVFSLNKGLLGNQISALAAVLLLRDYVFEGGFYPVGGMQEYPNVLLNKFKKLGGEILLNASAEKIVLANGKIRSILLNNGKIFTSKFLIACCDPVQIFKRIGIKKIDPFQNPAQRMKRSSSAFIIYLGVKKKIGWHFDYCSNTWFLNQKTPASLNTECKGMVNKIKAFLVCSPSFHDNSLAPMNRDSLILIINVPWKRKRFWMENKDQIAEYFINYLVEYIPKLKNQISFKQIATPQALYNYTLNYKGSAFGWASNPEQVYKKRFQGKTEIKNLYFGGHWTHSLAGYGGIHQATYSGRNLASILKEEYESSVL